MVSRERQYDELSETQKRGQATEAILKAEFLVRDSPVLSPEYDNEAYDFGIELDGQFHKMQAKTADQYSSGTVRFETVSTRVRSDGYDRAGYDGRIDYFCVYNPKLDEVYVIDIAEAASGKMEIRFRAPKNNQWNGINWHKEYLLDRFLETVGE
ncbi:MAG: group I intron-associated PD-(D/E)XK endonuclease [Halorientalis sp.]